MSHLVRRRGKMIHEKSIVAMFRGRKQNAPQPQKGLHVEPAIQREFSGAVCVDFSAHHRVARCVKSAQKMRDQLPAGGRSGPIDAFAPLRFRKSRDYSLNQERLARVTVAPNQLALTLSDCCAQTMHLSFAANHYVGQYPGGRHHSPRSEQDTPKRSQTLPIPSALPLDART